MRLIDADALGIGLCNPDIFMDRSYAAGWNGVVRLLQSAPTITPESLVRHGRWVKIENLGGDSHWMCSSCGVEWYFEADGPVENGSNYCPRCGAKMDLEGRHAESNH